MLTHYGNIRCTIGRSNRNGCRCCCRCFSCITVSHGEIQWCNLSVYENVIYIPDPIFPMIFLVNSWFPGMLDAILQATFLCALLLFWLCIYHGLRQNERKFLAFYLPKLIVCLPIWLCAIVLATWEKCNELRDPTYSHFVDTNNYNVSWWSAFYFKVCAECLFFSVQGFKTIFYVAGVMYLMYLMLLILKAYSELRSMPYFGKADRLPVRSTVHPHWQASISDMRLKFLTLLMIFVLSISVIVTTSRFGFGILEDNFFATLNTTYKSSAQFMCFYGLLNFYLYTMAYVYSPSGRPIHGEFSRIEWVRGVGGCQLNPPNLLQSQI